MPLAMPLRDNRVPGKVGGLKMDVKDMDNAISARNLGSRGLYKVLMWTPWDRPMRKDLSTQLQDALQMRGESFFDKCFIKPLGDCEGSKSRYDQFLDALGTGRDTAIILSSYSGVGKSTFLHAALYEKKLLDDALIFDMHNNERLPEGDLWDDWLEEKFQRAILTKVTVRMLLLKLYSILRIHIGENENEKVKNESEEKRKEHLRRIDRNYEKHFMYINDERIPLMNIISEYSKPGGKMEYSRNPRDPDAENCYVELAKKKVYELYAKDSPERTKITEELLKTISAFALCESEDIKNARRVIVFDNIEHYLNNKVLFDQEIHDLLMMVNGTDSNGRFIKEQNDRYRKIPLPDGRYDTTFAYSDHFPIVIAVREFSAIHLTNLNQSADNDGSPASGIIRLDNQIKLAKIIEKKCEFLNEVIPGINDLLVVKMIKEVLIDERERGIVEKISQMFSYNKRRAIRALIDALYYKEVRDGNEIDKQFKEDVVNDYLGMKAKIIGFPSSSDDNDVKDAYIYGARQMVYRALFDSIAYKKVPVQKEMSFFRALNMDETSNAPGSTHQILTLLSRRPLEDQTRNINIEQKRAIMLLSDLVIRLYRNPSQQRDINLKEFARNNDDRLLSLAEKLNYMRSRDRRFRWAPLVLFVFKEPGDVSTKRIHEKLREICEDPKCQFDEDGGILYGVKATFAARAFIEISPSFEFFAARFQPDSNALFSSEYLRNPNKSLEHIERVRAETFICISSIIRRANRFLKNQSNINYNELYSTNISEGGTDYNDTVRYLYRKFHFDIKKHSGIEITHPERIITNHIGYIENYRLFLTDQMLGSALEATEGRVTHEKIAKTKKEPGWDAERYSKCLFGDAAKTDYRAYLESFAIYEATVFAEELLRIISEYIGLLRDLTETKKSGNPPQFYIGGPTRTKKGGRYEWGDSPPGYKSLQKDLEKVRKYPLSQKFRFSLSLGD